MQAGTPLVEALGGPEVVSTSPNLVQLLEASGLNPTHGGFPDTTPNTGTGISDLVVANKGPTTPGMG